MPRAPITIVDLLGRGQAAYVAALSRVHTPETMPVGVTGINVVTRTDFELHPGICLEYVTTTRVLHILSNSGHLFALLSGFHQHNHLG